MLREIIGKDVFRRGMDIYFERCDGTAATIEDFLACFEKAAGRDLSEFKNWYAQSGTPRVTLSGRYDADARVFELTARQDTPPTPDQSRKRALPMPIRTGLLKADGAIQPLRLDGENEPGADERTLMLDGAEAHWRFVDVDAAPTLSAFRGFSAPVIVSVEEPLTSKIKRAAFDPNWFNRWEAGQSVARDALAAASDESVREGAPSLDDAASSLAPHFATTPSIPGSPPWR